MVYIYSRAQRQYLLTKFIKVSMYTVLIAYISLYYMDYVNNEFVSKMFPFFSLAWQNMEKNVLTLWSTATHLSRSPKETASMRKLIYISTLKLFQFQNLSLHQINLENQWFSMEQPNFSISVQ